MPFEDSKQHDWEKLRIFDLIESAFDCVNPPEDWKKFTQISDFEREFNREFLPEYWKYIYHLDRSKTQYALRFVMQYFASIIPGQTGDDIVNLEMLLMQLSPSIQHEFGFGDFYEAMYTQYSGEQKKAICDWLKFLREKPHYSHVSGFDEAISYWCKTENADGV